jgi:phage N-6-adenine-methyltransferase
METPNQTLICPICKRLTCECMLRDREFLARRVGRLMRGGAGSPATNNGGAGTGNSEPKDNGGAATPQWLFDHCSRLAIEACGEPIALDVAAAEWNHKCQRYFTRENDALKQDWNSRAAWCNPPYSADIIYQFVSKALDAARHGTTTFCLLPWWNYPYLDLSEQNGRIHRIHGPVGFRREDGTAFVMNNGYHSTPLVVVVFGPTIRPGFGAPIKKEDAGTATPPGDDDMPLADDARSTSSPTITPCREAFDTIEFDETADDLRQGDRPVSACDERYSPSWLAAGARLVMGEIDLDPASCPLANETIRACRYFSRETDGLARAWQGRVFVNPPYTGGVRRRIEKLGREMEAGRVSQATVILPADMLNAIGSAWFKVLLCGALLVPDKRIQFVDPAGSGTGPRFGSVVFYVGSRQLRFARVFGSRGVILRPWTVPGPLPPKDAASLKTAAAENQLESLCPVLLGSVSCDEKH